MSAPPAPSKTVSAEDLQIRRLRVADVPFLMPIESVSFGKHHWSEDSFKSEIKNQIGRYYTLLHQDQVIGYCGYWLILDEAHITTVAVDPAYRGTGLGEVLLIKMLDRMLTEAVKWVTLEVRVSNLAAQKLYHKYDFRSMGLRPRYYQDSQEDAMIMTTVDIQTPEFKELFRTRRQTALARFNGTLPEGLD